MVACRCPVIRQYSLQQQPVEPANRMQDHTLCWHQHLCECNSRCLSEQGKPEYTGLLRTHTMLVFYVSINKGSTGEEDQAVRCIEDATGGVEVRTSLTSLVMGMAGGTRGLLPSSSRVRNSILFSSSHSAYDPISRFLHCQSISQTTACSQHL